MISSMKIAGYDRVHMMTSLASPSSGGPGGVTRGNYREQNLNRGQLDKGESLISANYDPCVSQRKDDRMNATNDPKNIEITICVEIMYLCEYFFISDKPS